MWSARKSEPHPELQPPKVHTCVQYLWPIFSGLDDRRESGPLSFGEIDAWSRLTGRRLDGFELAALVAMDEAVMREVADHRTRSAQARKKQNDRHRSARR